MPEGSPQLENRGNSNRGGSWERLQDGRESSADPGRAADAWKKLKVPPGEGFPHHLGLVGGAYSKYTPYSEVLGLFFKAEPLLFSPIATQGSAGSRKSSRCAWDQHTACVQMAGEACTASCGSWDVVYGQGLIGNRHHVPRHLWRSRSSSGCRSCSVSVAMMHAKISPKLTSAPRWRGGGCKHAASVG